MLSLEHLIEHYMRFSDGLPINLRYPVPPKPKPPLPLFTTIPRNNRNKGMRPTAATSPPSTTTLPLQSLDDITHMATIHHHRSERKISADGFLTASNRTQRNLSIPSDELMNHVGIFSTSPSKEQLLQHQQQLQSPQQVAASPPDSTSGKKKSDILNFRSLKLPKKNIIKDGMKSLKKSKSPKDPAKGVAAVAAASLDAAGIMHTEEISQSLRNLTFSSDFKVNESTYNVPTNNGAVADIQNQKQALGDDINGSSSAAVPSIAVTTATASDDYFTKCDKTFHDELNDNAHDKDNVVEEIYFVDAPTTAMAPATSTFSYVPFKHVPYFPNAAALATNSDHLNNNGNNDALIPRHITRLSSTASVNSNESEQIMALQNQPNESSTTGTGNGGYRYRGTNCPPARPNYYIPKGSITLNEVLGEGEFGSVYKGTMTYETDIDGSASAVKVAIKTLHDEHCKENRAEFLREASVMIKLSHHCIVRLLGISKVIKTAPHLFCNIHFKSTQFPYTYRDRH